MEINEKQKALEKIAAEIERCRICKTNKTGLAVPGEGNPNAEVVFIGEAPGKQEAKTGRPFVGPSGKLLRQLITESGLKDTEVFITSPVKRLPVYVTPIPEDVAHGRVHLNKQLEIINPKIIVLLGRIAVLALLHKNVSIAKEHGTITEKDGQTYMIAYHPAAPLYSPKVKQDLISDFKKLKRLIQKNKS